MAGLLVLIFLVLCTGFFGLYGFLGGIGALFLFAWVNC